jgi:DNA-binding transcriptional regulator GbsR (MarR family)
MDDPSGGPVLERVYSTFGEVAKTLGYSPIHGKIIAALVANNREMSLQALARETGYSISMVSLSLDLLEVMGIIRKTRRPGDRNLYIALHGDLLMTLKDAIVMRLSKSISSTMDDFRESRARLSSMPPADRKKAELLISTLEREVKRLERYVSILSEAKLP